jgi:hypothetical protein
VMFASMLSSLRLRVRPWNAAHITMAARIARRSRLVQL